MTSKILKLPIIEQKVIAEKTNEVSFGLKEKKFSFTAGQHIKVHTPKLLYPDPRGKSRVFSVNSSPNNKGSISIAFRDSGSGFKKTLMNLPIDSLIDIEGPFGNLTLPKNPSQPIVFIAGGIGITPCLSMIRFAAEEKLLHPITLLYSNRDEESSAYLEELKSIEEKNHYFQLKNKFGRVDTDFIKESVKDLNEPLWYVTGPEPMVIAVKDLLFRLEINQGKIYFEEFLGY